MNANVCPSIYDADYRKLKTPPGRRSFLYDDEHQPLNFFVHGKVWVAFTPSFLIANLVHPLILLTEGVIT